MKLIVEPTDGVAPLLAAIKGAKRSVEIAIFRFDRTDVETALKAAAERGVKVTVLIAYANRGGEQRLRKLESRCLAAGITVARTADDLTRYHNKYILIDRRVLYMLSFNFTHLDIDHSRGFGIVSTHAVWVREAAKLFKADSTRTKYKPKIETFVVSPENARSALGTFLKRAKTQLLIYDVKLSDKDMLRILNERAKAGVEIKIIGSVGGRTQLDVQKLAGSRLHTRTIIRDKKQAFIGSQSLRAEELDARRELGLIVHDAKIVKTLIGAFESDWTSTKPKKESAASDAPEAAADKSAVLDKEAEKAVQTLKKDLAPLADSVKTAVRKAVGKSGEALVHDKDMKHTMKQVVKKAAKEAVKEAVQTAQDAEDAHDAKAAKAAKS